MSDQPTPTAEALMDGGKQFQCNCCELVKPRDELRLTDDFEGLCLSCTESYVREYGEVS